MSQFELCTVTSRRRTVRPVDDGQALGLVVIAIALIATVAGAIGTVAIRMTQRSTAQSAADAAAIAGVLKGRSAAAALAIRNGGELSSFTITGDGVDVTVTVRVSVNGESATARASNAP